jgi:serine protease Do
MQNMKYLTLGTVMGIAVALGLSVRAGHEETHSTTVASLQAAALNNTPEAGSAAVGTGGMALPDFRQIVRSVSPAIVKISVEGKANGQQMLQFGGQGGDPFEEFFKHFGNPGGRGGDPRGGNDGNKDEQEQQPGPLSFGSGFIISADGKILTNHHVVNDAKTITVTLKDHRQFKAKVIGSDDKTDVALIQIEASALPTVNLGNSTNVEVGEWVLAIGAPLNLDYSATQGIVSATDRVLDAEQRYVPFIQTDAAVNPGNSGGPLFNTKGQVIGINSQIMSRSGGYMGLSFAIPINTAMNIAKQLESTGTVARGYLGVNIQSLDQKMAKSFGLERPRGALVGGVQADTPAGKAGVKAGDVILAVNGKNIEDSADLPPLISQMDIGSKANLSVLRNGKTIDIPVTVGKLPGENQVAEATPAGELQQKKVAGLSVSELTAAQRKELQVNEGVVITDIHSTAAARAGLREGDVVLEVNRKSIRNAEDFSAAMSSVKKDDSTLFLIKRGDGSFFVAVEGLS